MSQFEYDAKFKSLLREESALPNIIAKNVVVCPTGISIHLLGKKFATFCLNSNKCKEEYKECMLGNLFRFMLTEECILIFLALLWGEYTPDQLKH